MPLMLKTSLYYLVCLSQKDSKEVTEHALYITPVLSLAHLQNWFLSTELGVSPKYCQVWPTAHGFIETECNRLEHVLCKQNTQVPSPALPGPLSTTESNFQAVRLEKSLNNHYNNNYNY